MHASGRYIKGIDRCRPYRFVSVSDRVIRAYRRELFGKSILQDLPDKPTFVFNATNLESGVLFRFSKPYLADYRVGRVMEPDLPVAVAVAASSAFPPILSPCTIDLSKDEWRTDPRNDLVDPEFRDELTLTDGGVYDNLGIETAWKRYRTILVSDGGGHLVPDPDPAHDWPEQMVRVLKVIDNQVRALRKRQIIEAFKSSPGKPTTETGYTSAFAAMSPTTGSRTPCPPIPKLPMSSPDYPPALRLSATLNSKD